MAKRKADEMEDRHADLAASIEAKVQNIDATEAMEYLDTLCAKWKLDQPTLSFEQTAALYFHNYAGDILTGLDFEKPGAYGMVELEENMRAQEMEGMALYHRLRELDMLTENPETQMKIRSVMETIYLSKKTVLLLYQGKLVENRLSGAAAELDDDLDAQLGS